MIVDKLSYIKVMEEQFAPRGQLKMFIDFLILKSEQAFNR